MITLSTPRLILRQWKETDLSAFAALNADPKVCEFLPSTLSKEESDAFADRIQKHFQEHGYGLWAVECKQDTSFIGYVGLNIPSFEAHFTPCVEIGWRLAHAYWGKGYATEAANAVLEYGFNVLTLPEIVSFTVPGNIRSRAVMAKIGMTHDIQGNFEHPRLPEGHPLRPHVLYRKSAKE